MDGITYKYLINIPKNKKNDNTPSLLECILILSLRGLYKKLFQKLNNYIETIKEDYYEKLLHQTNKLKLIDNHKINVNNENNIDNSNKLNLSITLIIENNKKNREGIEEEEIEKEEIEKEEIEEEKNYNNCTNGIEINYNYSLFQKVWGNIVIRNEILFHLRLYNSHWEKEICLSLKERKFEKKKSYQKEPNKDINNDDDNDDDEDDNVPLEKFPQSNIRSLYLNKEYDLFYKKMIPPSVISIHFGWYFEGGISKGMFGDNITSLSFSGPFFNEELSCIWLPKYLKLLKLDIGFQKDIKKDSLSCKKIPFSTTTLVLDDDFNQPIRVGDIPQNITNLSFGKSFSSSIGPNSLPKSTRILSLENLISVDFGEYFNRPLFSNMFSFSKSITTIIFGKGFTQQIAPGVFNHLKTLKFGDHFNSRILKNELPQSLTCLDLGGYNIPLDFGMFPNSLTSLTFHWFNKPIEIGIFPSSIESLNLGWNFNQIIKPGIFPKNLKYLDIYNSSFKQDLSIDGILPQSFKNLTISIDNLSLFQSFDSKFSSKYVKLFKTNN
ncbi:hypothetical protein ACTFIY_011319 [Dictyostelium cf. discoideum]